MGVSSSVCLGGRSICISDSLGTLPGHKETAVENLAIVQKPPSGKLHVTESRDSGIVANEIPYNYTLPNTLDNTEEEVEPESPALSPETERAPLTEDLITEGERPVRPHSCRLGHRGSSQLVARKNREKISSFKESKILNFLRSAKKSNKNRISNDYDANNNDTESVELSSSSGSEEKIHIDGKENTPRGSKRKMLPRLKSGKNNTKKTSQTVADLEISSDDDIGDEILSIPDETSEASCERDDSPYRKGWVRNEETGSDGISTSKPEETTPVSTSTFSNETGTHKVVSSNHYDSSIAKKASEMSISSIGLILTSTADDNCTPSPTNSDCFEWLYDFPFDSDLKLDDLVTVFTECLENRRSSVGVLGPRDYEHVLRKLRYRLVKLVAGKSTSLTAPSVEVLSENADLFTDSQWSAKIQLLDSDEEILQTSESQLAYRLAEAGDKLNRNYISCMLAEHFRTVEQLQLIRDSGLLQRSNTLDERYFSAPVQRKTDGQDEIRPRKHYRRIKEKISLKPETARESKPDNDIKETCDQNEHHMDKEPLKRTDSQDRPPISVEENGNTIANRIEYTDEEEEYAGYVTDNFILSQKEKWECLGVTDVTGILMDFRIEQARLFPYETEQSQDDVMEIERKISTLDKTFSKGIRKRLEKNVIPADEVKLEFREHMKKTTLIRVRSLHRSDTEPSVFCHKRAGDPNESNGIHHLFPGPIRRTSSLPKDGMGDITPDASEYRHFMKPPSARRQGSRMMTANFRERIRPGTTQTHGLQMETLDERFERNVLPKVEQIDTSKYSIRSRPDSGIAVSMSSGSYSSYCSSEATKETDDMDEACITDSPEMVEKVEKVRPEHYNDMKSLVAALTKGCSSQQLKAHALYCWIAVQKLPRFIRCTKKASFPSGRLRQLAEKKTTHASVYADMARIAGLKCEKIEGYVKSKDYLPGNTVQCQKFQHTWTAVLIDGQYRLIDAYFGSIKEKYYMDHYFMTSPDDLVLSHFPKERKWLLMNKMKSINEFEGTVKTWPAMFHFNIRPLSMKSVIRTYDGKLSITVLLRGVAVIPQLEYAGPGQEVDSDSLEDNIDQEIRDVDNAETFHIRLPQEGNYYFTLLAHVLEEELDVPVFQYRIEYTDELL